MERFNEPTHGNDDVFSSVLETHFIYRTSTEMYYKNFNRKNKNPKSFMLDCYWNHICFDKRGSSGPTVIMLHGVLIM